MNPLNLPQGLGLRPSTDSDKIFLEQLFISTREDLRLIDGERDFVEDIIEKQFSYQTRGYGDQFPNALYYIIEKTKEPIGKVVVEFGTNEVRLVDIAFIRQARGKGFGTAVIRALQAAAAKTRVPLYLSVMQDNFQAKGLYRTMGFAVDRIAPPYEMLVWYPTAELMH